jgi:hypothetical protein
MCIVILEDGTTYNVDTDSQFNAKSVVEYKLKQRLDFRRIQSVQVLKGVFGDKNSKYYNSGSAYDGIELHCMSGWSYKWR